MNIVMEDGEQFTEQELRYWVDQDIMYECKATMSEEDFNEFLKEEAEKGWWLTASVTNLIEYYESNQ